MDDYRSGIRAFEREWAWGQLAFVTGASGTRGAG